MWTSDDEAICELVAGHVAAWNSGDARGWVRGFAEDAAFVNILGMHFRGRDANERRHAELFSTIFKGSHLEVMELSVRRWSGSVATADAVFVLTGFPALPPGIRPTTGNALRTRMHYVLVRTDDPWQIVFSQNTAIMPMP